MPIYAIAACLGLVALGATWILGYFRRDWELYAAAVHGNEQLFEMTQGWKWGPGEDFETFEELDKALELAHEVYFYNKTMIPETWPQRGFFGSLRGYSYPYERENSEGTRVSDSD